MNPFDTRSAGKRTILLYGLVGGVLIAVLKLIEYRYLVREHSFEIYGGIIALIFAGVGIWLGPKLKKTRTEVVVREVRVAVTGPFTRNETRVAELGIILSDFPPRAGRCLGRGKEPDASASDVARDARAFHLRLASARACAALGAF
jgi:hypothetical protein